MSPLPSIFDTCIPRDEVLAGELPDAIFAADLWNVISTTLPQEAYREYCNPREFFKNSYPTESMKLLIKDISARLAGAQGVAPVFRLETGFGGGKTHNIIAAVHIAREGAGVADLLGEYGVERLPEPGSVSVAAFVGDQADPVSGIRHSAGGEVVRTYTPWGEIAFQLGGVEAFRIVQENDEQGIAPSRQALEDICNNRPALIVLDELVLYFAKVLHLRDDHPRRNVVRQMPTFLQTLFTFAANRPGTAVIFTLPSEQDANRHITAELKQHIPDLLDVVDEMEQSSNRQARNLTPTQSYERAAVLARRLFRSVNSTCAGDIAEVFLRYYEEQNQHGVELDRRALEPSYQEQIRNSYPFHPELIRLFAERLVSIPEFHATRGALRLVARTIRAVWDRRSAVDPPLLLQPHHVDLSRSELRDELLARLGRQNFAPALEADVVKPGGDSHAAQVEQGWPSIAATEAATVVFLHSLPSGSRGLSPAETALSVGRPGYDLAYIKKGLEETARIGWYLDADTSGRYLFKDRATLNKRFQERAAGVSSPEIKEALDDWIISVYSGFQSFQVIPFPVSHLDIPDTGDRLRLVIVHYDKECGFVGGGERLSFTTGLFSTTGMNRSPRVYRNNVIFLLAQEGRVAGLKDIVRNVFAWERIREDLENEQRRLAEGAGQDYRIWKSAARSGAGGVPPDFLALERDLESVELKRGEADLAVRTKLLEAYRILACPPIPDRDENLFLNLRTALECYRVDFGESSRGAASRSRRDGQRAREPVEESPILECLRHEARKLVPEPTEESPVVLAPTLLMQEPLWHAGEKKLSTQEIWERLRKDPDLPVILKPQDLLPSFRAGLLATPEVLWYYYDQGNKKTYTRETAAELSPVLSRVHFIYGARAALEDRILPPSIISADEFWRFVWPRENGSPVSSFSTIRIQDLVRSSDHFPVLPAPAILWQTLREGARENRWVLFRIAGALAFGAQEINEWPSLAGVYGINSF